MFAFVRSASLEIVERSSETSFWCFEGFQISLEMRPERRFAVVSDPGESGQRCCCD